MNNLTENPQSPPLCKYFHALSKPEQLFIIQYQANLLRRWRYYFTITQEAKFLALGELELELIQAQMTRTRTRTNTNPNGTEANAAGRSVRACDARKSKS